MTASNDRRLRCPSYRPSPWQLLRLLLAAAVLTTLFSFEPPRVARADELSDAVAQQQALAKQIAQQKRDLANLNAAQANLQGQIKKTQTNLTNVSQELSKTQGEINTLKGSIKTVQAQYDKTVAQLNDLEAELLSIQRQETDKARELEERKKLLAARIVAAYEANQQSLLEQLLQAESIADLLSDLSYYMDMGEQDKALALQIQQDQKTLAQLHQNVAEARDGAEQLRQATAEQKKLLDAEMAQLAAAQQKLAALKKQIEAQLAQQRASEAKLAANKQALAAAIAADQKDQAALASKIDQLLAQQASKGAVPSQYSGSFVWPMGGYVTQEYGCTGFYLEPPWGNCAHFHKGIDIAAPCGTPIRAAGAGRVLFVGYEGTGAWDVIIAHADNLATLYAHGYPSAPAGVYAGAWVRQGQVIMWEGMTGHATGCHLHWGVRLNGTYVNPRLFV